MKKSERKLKLVIINLFIFFKIKIEMTSVFDVMATESSGATGETLPSLS